MCISSARHTDTKTRTNKHSSPPTTHEATAKSIRALSFLNSQYILTFQFYLKHRIQLYIFILTYGNVSYEVYFYTFRYVESQINVALTFNCSYDPVYKSFQTKTDKPKMSTTDDRPTVAFL